MIENMHVLIVDDDFNVKTTIDFMLKKMGVVNVEYASDGDYALQYLDDPQNRVDFIICDWNMPKKTGIELLREVRTVDPDLPFFLVTGRADPESIVTAKAAGVSGYILKPFSFKDFEKKLSILLKDI